MKPPSIVIDHFLSTKWSKKLFTINHYELQNGKCIVTQELSAYLWTYKDTKAPIVSYLESEYGYNPEHTYWASNPLELLDYIRDTCQVPENKIVFVDYQANKSLPYQTALSKTQYTRIGPLDFIVESESRHYRETKKYISCYAKEFANCYMNAYYI